MTRPALAAKAREIAEAAAEPLAKLLHPEAWFFGGRQEDRDAALARARGMLTVVVLPHIRSALTEAGAAATERAAKVFDQEADLRAERERCALAAEVRAQELRRAATPGAFPIAAAFDDFAAAIRNQP